MTQKEPNLLIPWSLTSGLQSCEMMHFCCLSLPGSGDCSGSPRKLTRRGTKYTRTLGTSISGEGSTGSGAPASTAFYPAEPTSTQESFKHLPCHPHLRVPRGWPLGCPDLMSFLPALVECFFWSKPLCWKLRVQALCPLGVRERDQCLARAWGSRWSMRG